MKKHSALKQNIKNDTCIEFRRDIKALTLLINHQSNDQRRKLATIARRTKLTALARVDMRWRNFSSPSQKYWDKTLEEATLIVYNYGINCQKKWYQPAGSVGA